MKPTLLVMAAGMGSRYGGLKQLDPIGPVGELIIDYSIFDAVRAGFGRVVIVVRPEIEAEFRKMVGHRFEQLLPVSYVYQTLESCTGSFQVPTERTKPWGTAHAMLVAQDEIYEPFAVINADDFYGSSSYQLMCDFLTSEQSAQSYALVGYGLRDTLSAHGQVARGICELAGNSMLQTIVEHKRIEPAGDGARSLADDDAVRLLSGDEIVSMNLWGFQPGIFHWLELGFAAFLSKRGSEPTAELYIGDVVNRLLADQKVTVQVLKAQSDWFGVTYREDGDAAVSAIQQLIDQGIYPARLFR